VEAVINLQIELRGLEAGSNTTNLLNNVSILIWRVSILCSGQEAAEAVINLLIELRGLEAAGNTTNLLNIVLFRSGG
jgi:hypothetical protein